jgi:hypothetical protein
VCESLGYSCGSVLRETPLLSSDCQIHRRLGRSLQARLLGYDFRGLRLSEIRLLFND